MIEIPGKGKGKLCSGGLDCIPEILKRVDEILEQRRLAEAASGNEVGMDAEGQPSPQSSENGLARSLTTTPLTQP